MDFENFKVKNWSELEQKLESLSSNKLKGDLFECFVYFFFRYHESLYDVRDIYCPIVDKKPYPSHILQKLKLERKDHGVDGVIITSSGDYIAWQAKFRSNRANPTARELSTFWAESEYADYRMIASNCIKLPSVAGKKSGHLSLLVDRFLHLPEDFFSSMYAFFSSSQKVVHKKQKKPRDYQNEIISNILEGFKTHEKGKVIAACGIGKTLISLWTVEQMGLKKVLFFAPSLQLIRQTIEEWSIESVQKFKYICVCSDQSVTSQIDSNNVGLDEIDIPVTTSTDEIKKRLAAHDDSEILFVFSTYQSSKTLSDAIDGDFMFDLIVYDEAHRTTGVGDSALFTHSVKDSVIPAKYRLFLTATERLIRPALKKNAALRDIPAFTMDDESVYGPIFHRLTFGEAIKRRIISDYRIVVSGIQSADVLDAVRLNSYLKSEFDNAAGTISADNLYRILLLKKVITDLGIKKIISFHTKIEEAKLTSRVLNQLLENVFAQTNVFISHINGSMSAQERADIISSFEDADIGVLTNVRCLTEGVDIPLIDGVYFSDPKSSTIDIVQAVGRALRQEYGKQGQLAYVIIPILLDDASTMIDSERFESLFNLIQALRDQDEALAEWIDGINSAAVRGRKSGTKFSNKIIVHVPRSIELEAFEENLSLQIADINKDPVGTVGIGSKLGKSQRKGSIDRVFKTIIDYTYESCFTSLVKPTLELMSNGVEYRSEEIKINNNNISHCKRLGLIIEVSKGNYRLSRIGILLKHEKITFEEVFKNQILLFKAESNGKVFHPYRLAIKFILEVGELNYIQFLYSLYAIEFQHDGTADIDDALKKAQWIEASYPNIHLTSEGNKERILQELNEELGVEFTFNNVWTDRTTAGNQFRYLIRHLELFSGLFKLNNKKITYIPEKKHEIEQLLLESKQGLEVGQYGNYLWIKN